MTNDEPQDHPVRVVIADDDPVVRRVLREVLVDAGLDVVGEAATGRECAEMTVRHQPELAIIDLVMPDGDGIDAIHRIRRAGCNTVEIVMLTSAHDDESAVLALREGASGFLTKDIPLEHLPQALRAALSGEAVISRRLSRLLLDRLREAPASRTGVRPVRSPLTSREWEVLDLLCESRGTEQIAEELVLSIETVRSHIKSILRKMGASNRQEAVAKAPALRAPPI